MYFGAPGNVSMWGMVALFGMFLMRQRLERAPSDMNNSKSIPQEADMGSPAVAGPLVSRGDPGGQGRIRSATSPRWSVPGTLMARRPPTLMP